MKVKGFLMAAAIGATVGAVATNVILTDPKTYRAARRCKNKAIKTMDHVMNNMMHG